MSTGLAPVGPVERAERPIGADVGRVAAALARLLAYPSAGEVGSAAPVAGGQRPNARAPRRAGAASGPRSKPTARRDHRRRGAHKGMAN